MKGSEIMESVVPSEEIYLPPDRKGPVTKKDVKFNKLAETAISIISDEQKCALFCGGKKCRYCGYKAWKPHQMALNGIYSHWITNKILAMARPGKVALKKFNLVQQFLDAGVRSVINLETPGEHSACGAGLEASGFSYDPQLFMDHDIFCYNFAWKDFGATSVAMILDIVKVMEFCLTEGKMAVHCHAGLGRTGVLIACFLAFTYRMSGNDSINYLRTKRPGCIQTRGQMKRVIEFCKYLYPLRVIFTSRTTNVPEYTLKPTEPNITWPGVEATQTYAVNLPYLIMYVVCERLLQIAGSTPVISRQSSTTSITPLSQPSALEQQAEHPRKKLNRRLSHSDTDLSYIPFINPSETIAENPHFSGNRRRDLFKHRQSSFESYKNLLDVPKIHSETDMDSVSLRTMSVEAEFNQNALNANDVYNFPLDAKDIGENIDIDGVCDDDDDVIYPSLKNTPHASDNLLAARFLDSSSDCRSPAQTSQLLSPITSSDSSPKPSSVESSNRGVSIDNPRTVFEQLTSESNSFLSTGSKKSPFVKMKLNDEREISIKSDESSKSISSTTDDSFETDKSRISTKTTNTMITETSKSTIKSQMSSGKQESDVKVTKRLKFNSKTDIQLKTTNKSSPELSTNENSTIAELPNQKRVLTVPATMSDAANKNSKLTIGWALTLDAYTDSVLDRAIEHETALNSHGHAWASLAAESDPAVLCCVMWHWFDTLKEPVLRVQDLISLLDESLDPVAALSTLEKGTRATIEYLLKVLLGLHPMPASLEDRICEVLFSHLTHQHVLKSQYTKVTTNITQNTPQRPCKSVSEAEKPDQTGSTKSGLTSEWTPMKGSLTRKLFAFFYGLLDFYENENEVPSKIGS